MDTIILITGFLVGLAILIVIRAKRTERETDYRTFFILAICFFPLGIVWIVIDLFPLGIVFLGLGVVYLSIALANKDKWRKKSKET